MNHINHSVISPFLAIQAYQSADNNNHLYKNYAALLDRIKALAATGQYFLECTHSTIYRDYHIALEELGYKVEYDKHSDATRISWDAVDPQRYR